MQNKKYSFKQTKPYVDQLLEGRQQLLYSPC